MRRARWSQPPTTRSRSRFKVPAAFWVWTMGSHESYQGHSRKAFNGLALVILQSTGLPGTMTLSAFSLSLPVVRICVEVS